MASGEMPGRFRLDAEAPSYLDDPYPIFHALRSQCPVYQAPGGVWYLTRFDDVTAVLNDGRFERRSPAGAAPISSHNRPPTAIDRMLSRWMVFIDPPAHTRLRRLVGQAFTPQLIAALRTDIRIIADDLLDRAIDGGDTFDVIADFAFPLPVIVVSRILGLPREDYARLKVWSAQLTGALDTGEPEQLATGDAAAAEISAYMDGLIEERRRDPREDLISALLAESASGRGLSAEELVANCVFLLWAGHETTKNLIGNGTLSLIRHPGELARLAADLTLLESAVDEFLRYESPIQKIGRWAREPVTLGDVKIPAGSYVVGLFGAANRDPARFADPDRFDVGRRAGPGVAFGKGIHHCLGYRLALLEGVLAFAALLERVGALEPHDATPRWQANSSIRGLESLPVSVRRR